MAHELHRLRESMLNTPHLATQATYDSVAEYLDTRNAGMAVAGADKGSPWQASVKNGVAILEVNGALTYRASAMEAMCGGMSYETLYSRYMSVVEAGASTVVLQMGSGGGQAVGVFDVATMIRQHATDNNISLITYVDTLCASAALALGCISDEVIMAADSSIGSVGVVIALRNDSEKQKADGITTQYVYSGKNKIGKDAEGKFTEEFLADMQANCDALYETFCEHVAMYSGITVDAVKATEASVYRAREALEIGFADKVMSRQDFAAYLNTKEKTKGKPMLSKIFNKGAKAEMQAEAPQEEVEMNAELQAKVAELQTGLEGALAELAEHKSLMADYKAEKEAAVAALAAKVEAEAQAKAESRKAELAAVVGEASLDAMFNAVGGLSDEAFAMAMTGFKAGNAAQKETEMFKELGTAAEAKVPEQKSAVEALAEAVAQKYSSSK